MNCILWLDLYPFFLCVFSCIWGWNRSRTEETHAAPGFRPTAASRSWPDASRSLSDGTRSNPVNPWPWSTGSAVHSTNSPTDSVSKKFTSHVWHSDTAKTKWLLCLSSNKNSYIKMLHCMASFSQYIKVSPLAISVLRINFVSCSSSLILEFKYRW